MTIAEIVAEITGSMNRCKEYWAQRAAISKAYDGPERRRAPRIAIEGEAHRIDDTTVPVDQGQQQVPEVCPISGLPRGWVRATLGEPAKHSKEGDLIERRSTPRSPIVDDVSPAQHQAETKAKDAP